MSVRLVLVCLFLTVFTACSSVRIGEPYDAEIDAQLNSFQTSAAAFIKDMDENSSSKDGSYTSDKAKKYYVNSSAVIANLELRAKLLSARECPSKDISDGMAVMLPSGLKEFAAEDRLVPPKLEGLNCISVAIAAVRVANQSLEYTHKSKGRITHTTALLKQEAIDNSTYMALSAIRSKKY